MGFPVNSFGYCLECGGGGITPHHNWCSHHGEKFEWMKSAEDKRIADLQAEVERLAEYEYELRRVAPHRHAAITHRWAERKEEG